MTVVNDLMEGVSEAPARHELREDRKDGGHSVNTGLGG